MNMTFLDGCTVCVILVLQDYVIESAPVDVQYRVSEWPRVCVSLFIIGDHLHTIPTYRFRVRKRYTHGI